LIDLETNELIDNHGIAYTCTQVLSNTIGGLPRPIILRKLGELSLSLILTVHTAAV
jgi:hypothetical protein